MANRTSATMAIVSRVDNFTARPCLNRTPPERAGKMAPRGETAAHAGGPGDRHQCADHRPRGKASRPRPSPAKASRNRAPSWRLAIKYQPGSHRCLDASTFRRGNFLASGSPLQRREHPPSRMSLDLLKFPPTGARATSRRARLCGAQANSYDGKRTLRRGRLLRAPRYKRTAFRMACCQ